MARSFGCLTLLFLLIASGADAQHRADADSDPFEYGDAIRYTRGGQLASGQYYNPERFTAAHASLPFGTLVDVTFRRRTVTVRINDRDTGGAVVRLSARAADQLGLPPGGGDVELRLDPAEVAYLQRRQAREQQVAKPAEERVVAEAVDAGPQEFAIQIASFTDEGRAVAHADRMRGMWIDRVMVDGRALYRVYFGRYTSSEAARAALEDLRARGEDGFVQQVGRSVEAGSSPAAHAVTNTLAVRRW